MSAQQIPIFHYRDGEIPFAGPIGVGDVDIYGIALDGNLYTGESISGVVWDAGGLTSVPMNPALPYTDLDGRSYNHLRAILISGGLLDQIYTISGEFALTGGGVNRTINVSFKVKCVQN